MAINLATSSKIEYLLQFIQTLPTSQKKVMGVDALDLQRNNLPCKLLPALSTFRKSKCNEFSIMSWNILIKDYHYRYYGYLEEEYKQWQHRLPKLQETMTSLNTDIICLQEAHLPSFNQDFGDYLLKNGNYRIILNDVRAKKKGFTMTTPILFKQHKFKSIYQDFRSKATVALLQFIDAQQTNTKQKCDSKPNTATNKKKKKQNKVILDATKSYVWIANVHLEGNPSRPDVRYNQIKRILDRITNKTKEYKLNINNVFAVFTGDFNAGQGEVVDELLLKGGLKFDYRQKGYNEVDIVKSNNETDYKHEWKFNNAYWKKRKYSHFMRGILLLGLITFIIHQIISNACNAQKRCLIGCHKIRTCSARMRD
eukprot:638055_1